MVSQEFKRQSRSVLLEQIRQILEGREGVAPRGNEGS